jgi:hypothetical protein
MGTKGRSSFEQRTKDRSWLFGYGPDRGAVRPLWKVFSFSTPPSLNAREPLVGGFTGSER